MTQVISFTDYTPAPRFDSVPWDHVEVEEGTTSVGPWTLIDTIALSPLDADPASPMARSFTTANASDTPDLWYRVTFTDTSGGVGQPSAAVQNKVDATNPLVTLADMEARLGITFTTAESARAQTLLDMAIGLVRGHCKQHISLVTDDTLTIPGRWASRILLPERPVVNVSAVTATFYTGQAVELPGLTWYVDRDELVRYPFPLGLQRFFYTSGNGWLGPGYKMVITYTHGYDVNADPLPYQLLVAQSVALDSAIRAFTNPSGLAQSEIGGILESYPPGNGMLLNAEEKWNLDDVFRRDSQTIRLR